MALDATNGGKDAAAHRRGSGRDRRPTSPLGSVRECAPGAVALGLSLSSCTWIAGFDAREDLRCGHDRSAQRASASHVLCSEPRKLATGMRCSLIVLNYEGEQVIEACVGSLLTAMGPSDELIVVDNASTDQSRTLLCQYGDRIRLLLLPTNTFIFGLNAGLHEAHGQYVAFLNNDITVEPDFVDECVAALQRGGDDVFAVCPRILQEDGGDQGSRTAGVWSRGLLFYQSLSHSDTATDCFFAVGGQSVYRRSCLAEIGSIDPLLWPMYHEDIELSYRAWKRGWRIIYAPAAVAHHRGGHSSKRAFSTRQLRAMVRQNEFLMVWKNITDAQLIASHVAMLPARILVSLIKRDWPTIIGFGRALRRLPLTRKRRRIAKRHFRLSDREVLQRVTSIV